jgi:hypothetical protein
MYRKRNIFIVLQPFQYLQALELHDHKDDNYLLLLGDVETNQLSNIVEKDIWTEVKHFPFNGSVLDLYKNRVEIKKFLNLFDSFDSVIISSQYNEFMNLICNYYPRAEAVLLDDGMANLLSDDKLNEHYFKRVIKQFFCSLFGFNVRRVFGLTLFTMFESFLSTPPAISKSIRINKFEKLKNRINKFVLSDDVLFISSAFVSNQMLTFHDYSNFIIELANKNISSKFTVVLHRFDDYTLFKALEDHRISVVRLGVPIEYYFLKQDKLPKKVITSGSGATESLRLIFGIEAEVVFPDIELFSEPHKNEILKLKEYFDKHKN